MLSLLLALQIAQQSMADSVLAAARRAVTSVTDTSSARANGFVPVFGARVDRTPFQGEHWSSSQRMARDTTVDIRIAEPTMVMFGSVDNKMKRLGAAYVTRIPQGTAGPRGLGGDPAAPWHTHQLCRNVPGLGAVLADGAEDCLARGGTTSPRQIFMVHVWTDVPNPEGMYGHDNPALPYLALGLKPPGMHDLRDPKRVRAIRSLAMALAETYDARMQVSRRVERSNRDSLLANSLRVHRAAISEQIPALKAADASGNQKEYDRISATMVAEWEEFAKLYERMAPTPQLRALVKHENETASTRSHH